MDKYGTFYDSAIITEYKVHLVQYVKVMLSLNNVFTIRF